MQSFEVGNDKIRLRFAVGRNPGGLGWMTGIFIESILDLVADYEYLTSQAYLFE